MRQGKGRRWLQRAGALAFGRRGPAAERVDLLQRESQERRRLSEVLAHEREKVGKLKRRLAEIEASEESRSAEMRELYTALTSERHPPELSSADEAAWTDSIARGRRSAEAREAELAASLGPRPSVDGPLRSPIGGRHAKAAWRPLRIAIASPAISAFRGCADPRVIARPIGHPLVADADVLVFPHAEGRAYLGDAHRVPEPLWRKVREGATRVILDGSGEGYPHSAEVSREHHAFLDAHGADPARTLYLTQDRGYRADYEAWSRAEAQPAMHVHVFDTYIGRALSEFELCGSQAFKHRLAHYLQRPPRRSRRFVSLNYTPRPTKLVFLLRLLRDELWDAGWISFGGFDSEGEPGKLSRDGAVRRLVSLDGFADETPALLPLIDRLEALGPMTFAAERFRLPGKTQTASVKAADIEQYGDSWFSVVTETEMSDRLHRITEKPLKPLLGLHPFLMLGSPGALELLRGYGFETFSGVFDERYDSEPDPRRRFDMVYGQVRSLCALDEAEMARMAARLDEVVVFNACWGLTELPRWFRRTRVAELVDQLMPAMALEPSNRVAPLVATA